MADEPLAKANQLLEDAYSYEEDGALASALDACDEIVALLDESDEAEARIVLAEAHNLTGIILEGKGRLHEAETAYRAALEASPDMADAAENLCLLLQDLSVDQQKLVTIAAFSQAAEAHIVRGRIRMAGIPAFVADEEIVTANWLWSNAVGGVKVRVRQEDVEAALDILNSEAVDEPDADTSIEAEEEEEIEEDWITCPRCGSDDLSFEKYNNRAVFALWFFVGFPVPILKERWTCKQCGYQWREEELDLDEEDDEVDEEE